MTTDLTQLHAHMRWADAMAWSAALATADSESDERLTGLLHHVHHVQRVYLQILRGDVADTESEPSGFDSLRGIMAWGREGHAGLQAFTDRIGPEDLDREVTFPWEVQLTEAAGPVHPASVRQALLQLPSHSTYHRGQIATRIRELGGEPPLTDFVAWVWRGRPAPEWP